MAKTYYQENGQLHPLEIVTAVTGGPTPPAVDNTMVVTATDAGGGTFKADKTAAEIADAEAAGKIIELRYNTDRYQFVGMVGENESQAAQFDRIGVSETDIDQLTIFIDLDGNIRTENSLYEHDITLGIMGATTGKAAVVRSIDDAGHPTSWGLESIPGAYRLPHASAGSLGGVKADPKTDEDTQPVHIGEDNKLYTKPGEGGEKGMDLLWTNPNPTTMAGETTINIPDMVNYRYLLITCFLGSNVFSDGGFYDTNLGNSTISLTNISQNTGNLIISTREAYIMSNSIHFRTGRISTGRGNPVSDTSACVPYRVYGFN